MQQNISLLPYNTFGIDVAAEYFADVAAIGELDEFAREQRKLHILGGGSNLLLTQNVTGIVLRNRLKGIKTVQEDEDNVWLEVSSGEIWHELVMHTVEKGWGGLENLALIPGTVGASPIQNIGAYGREAKETIESVNFWHWADRNLVTLKNDECHFGYRDSIFKNSYKDKAFITSVVFRLQKHPVFNTSYGAIEQELEAMNVSELSVASIAQAVINIRSSKLPDPKKIGNAGSFFKNPAISKHVFEQLKHHNPGVPSYPFSDEMVKVPAGWLIEQCGWKGYRAGNVGVHAKQALVLVNYGHAKGNEIWQLSTDIVASVNERFGIILEREVQVW